MRNNHFDALFDFMKKKKKFVKGSKGSSLKAIFISFVVFFFVKKLEIIIKTCF